MAAAGLIAGPALGGVLLLATGSTAVAFAVNALTFAAAAAFTLAIEDRRAFTSVRTGPRDVLAWSARSRTARRHCGPTRRRFAWWAPTSCAAWSTGCRRCCLSWSRGNAGPGMHGYGYLFAAIGAGGLAGTALAGRVARLPLRVALAASLAMVGVPMLAMPLAHWAPAALLLAGFTGAGAICVEIMTETGLQRMLDDEVFGRAYGLALPASIAGIAAGSLVAPVPRQRVRRDDGAGRLRRRGRRLQRRDLAVPAGRAVRGDVTARRAADRAPDGPAADVAAGRGSRGAGRGALAADRGPDGPAARLAADRGADGAGQGACPGR